MPFQQRVLSPKEIALKQAIEALRRDPTLSYRTVAREYGVVRSTLTARLAGAQPPSLAHRLEQRLTEEQEDFLCKWILEQDSLGFAPSHQRTRELARRILAHSGDHDPLGRRWLNRFMFRNPSVASVIGRPLESARAHATQPEHIDLFYTRYEHIRKKFDIRDEDTWNMDEHGIALGVCTNTRVLADANKKKALIQSPENREWVTVMETISAAGHATRPGIIFKGASVQSKWFTKGEIPHWFYTTSPKGWTSNAVGLRWLKEIFLPDTARDDARHRLLILDGHGSHCTVEFMWECHINNVHLLFLPPHSSHVLQPLDLGTFVPLKSRYRRFIAELAVIDDAAPVKKKRFVKAYQHARTETFTRDKLLAGWRASGLAPLDRSKGLNSSLLCRARNSLQEPTTATPSATDCPATRSATHSATQDLALLPALSPLPPVIDPADPLSLLAAAALSASEASPQKPALTGPHATHPNATSSQKPKTPRKGRRPHSSPFKSPGTSLRTPKNPRDLNDLVLKLPPDPPLSHPTRYLFNKAGKKIGLLQAEKAGMEAEAARLQRRLQELENKSTRSRGKRVHPDPNHLFANIEAIKKAKEEEETAEALQAAREPVLQAQKAARQMMEADMAEFMQEWQAVDYLNV